MQRPCKFYRIPYYNRVWKKYLQQQVVVGSSKTYAVLGARTIESRRLLHRRPAAKIVLAFGFQVLVYRVSGLGFRVYTVCGFRALVFRLHRALYGLHVTSN